MADVHQPLHAGFAEDRGGNQYQVQAYGRGTNLHALWDSALIEHWSGGIPALQEAMAEQNGRQFGTRGWRRGFLPDCLERGLLSCSPPDWRRIFAAMGLDTHAAACGWGDRLAALLNDSLGKRRQSYSKLAGNSVARAASCRVVSP
jgi:hypothetical protein